MNRKIIDYIVVEVKEDPYKHNQYYSPANKGNVLDVSLNIKNLEYEILILENRKTLLHQGIEYIDELLNTVEDLSIYKVSQDDILFYEQKHNSLHPLNRNWSLDPDYSIELPQEVKKHQNDILSIDEKIVVVKNEIHNLKIKKSALLENNKNLDFETCRTDFEKTVIYYLEKGYEPQGGIATRYHTYYTIYCQAMVKYE